MCECLDEERLTVLITFAVLLYISRKAAQVCCNNYSIDMYVYEFVHNVNRGPCAALWSVWLKPRSYFLST